MENQKSSGLGCFSILAISVAVITLIGYLCWDLPVGKTDEGDQVIVGDYVMGPLSDLVASLRSGKSNAEQSSPSASEASSANATGTKDKIDAELFDDLKPGVTTEPILQGLLNEGELVSSSNVAGISTESYIIRNSDGSYATLIFQNGTLGMKSQSGLY